MKCQKCDREIEEAKFCPYCGEKQMPVKKKNWKKILLRIVIVAIIILIFGAVFIIWKKQQASKLVNIYQLAYGGKAAYKSAEIKAITFKKDGTVSETKTLYDETSIEKEDRNISYDIYGHMIGYKQSFEEEDDIKYDFKLYEGGMQMLVHSYQNGEELEEKYVYVYDAEGKIVSAEIYELNTSEEQCVGYIDLVYDDKGNVIYASRCVVDGTLINKRWIDYDSRGRMQKVTACQMYYGTMQLDHIQTIAEYYYGED